MVDQHHIEQINDTCGSVNWIYETNQIIILSILFISLCSIHIIKFPTALNHHLILRQKYSDFNTVMEAVCTMESTAVLVLQKYSNEGKECLKNISSVYAFPHLTLILKNDHSH